MSGDVLRHSENRYGKAGTCCVLAGLALGSLMLAFAPEAAFAAVIATAMIAIFAIAGLAFGWSGRKTTYGKVALLVGCVVLAVVAFGIVTYFVGGRQADERPAPSAASMMCGCGKRTC